MIADGSLYISYVHCRIYRAVCRVLLSTLKKKDKMACLRARVVSAPSFSLVRFQHYYLFSLINSMSNLSSCRWFWSIVRDMTPIQRMKLLYFLTGSAVLPAYDNKIGNNGKPMRLTIPS